MSDDKAKTAAIATFTQYLQRHKLRKTPERFAILEKVFDMSSHFSIDSLHSRLVDESYHVSRATVYNTIELLIDAGLVRRHTFGSQSPQYEKIAGLSKHYHLVCTRCGKIKEIKDNEIDDILNTRRFGKFHPAYVDLNVYGLCATCQRRTRTEKADPADRSPRRGPKEKSIQ